MDPQTLLGMIFTFVFAIVVTTAISRLALKMLALRERRMELQAGNGAAAADSAAKAEQLEKRVQVLERLATERGYDVVTQIEALRDQRRVDGLDSGVPLGSHSRERV